MSSPAVAARHPLHLRAPAHPDLTCGRACAGSQARNARFGQAAVVRCCYFVEGRECGHLHLRRGARDAVSVVVVVLGLCPDFVAMATETANTPQFAADNAILAYLRGVEQQLGAKILAR